MYRTIVKRRARQIFDSLSRGDFDAVIQGTAPDVHHIFPGDNALGGERHTREAMGRWFERLDAIFDGHRFEVRNVVVKGWPWDTVVAVEWAMQARTRDGASYQNEGVHVIRLRWGRGIYVHAYLDTEKVTAACRRSEQAGVAEAGAPPIVD